MTDADLTLRDEVAEVFGEHGYDGGWRCECGWTGGWEEHNTHLADALLPLLARVREEGRSEYVAAEPLYQLGISVGEARIRERVEAVLEPVARSQYVSGRRGGKTFLGQFVSELRAALAEPTEGDQ